MHQDFKVISNNERQVRYNHIEDIIFKQSLFGRIFGFSTVVPVTGSGLGTGTDEAMRAAARDRYRYYRERGYALHPHNLDPGRA